MSTQSKIIWTIILALVASLLNALIHVPVVSLMIFLVLAAFLWGLAALEPVIHRWAAGPPTLARRIVCGGLGIILGAPPAIMIFQGHVSLEGIGFLALGAALILYGLGDPELLILLDKKFHKKR